MRLKDKVALVTGGGSGIGQGIAKMFTEEGARVMIMDWDAEGGEKTVGIIEEAGGEARFTKADVSQSSDVERAVQEVINTWGRLDILVNNAGIVKKGTTTETTENEWDAVMDINLKGVFLCAKASIPAMIRGGEGAIINIASVGGLRGSRGLAAYSTAKAGVINYTRQMAVDYGRQGIRVNCICPGTIVTPMHEIWYSPAEQEQTLAEWAKNRPLNLSGEPQDIAYPAVYLASDEARFVTGSVIVVDGGATAGGSG
jgi:NAD(P)-dependent dehydrogenase (short-subunit alcohol dehydrogenase family)